MYTRGRCAYGARGGHRNPVFMVMLFLLIVLAFLAILAPAFLLSERQALAQESAPPAAAPPSDTAAPEVSLDCPKNLSMGVSGSVFDPEPSSGIWSVGYEIYRSDLGILLTSGACSTDGAGGISCPPFSLTHSGSYSYVVWAEDRAYNQGSASCDALFVAEQQKDFPGRPDLGLYENGGFNWASYADYLSRDLTIPLMIYNGGANIAHVVLVTGNPSTSGVTISTPLPLPVGAINPGEVATFTLRHHLPIGVYSYGTTIEASAQDVAGETYSYP